MEVKNADLKTLINDFLGYLLVEKSLSPLTIRDYRLYLDRFATWLDNNSLPSKPELITLDNVHKYRIFLAGFVNKNGASLKKVTQTYMSSHCGHFYAI